MAGQLVSRLIFLMAIPTLELVTLAGYIAIKKRQERSVPTKPPTREYSYRYS